MVMSVIEAFEAKKNAYFDYDFNPIDVDDNFPDCIYKSLVGELYKHVIEYPDATYCIYYSEQLLGEEWEKLQHDWQRYCPHA